MYVFVTVLNLALTSEAHSQPEMCY